MFTAPTLILPFRSGTSKFNDASKVKFSGISYDKKVPSHLKSLWYLAETLKPNLSVRLIEPKENLALIGGVLK